MATEHIRIRLPKTKGGVTETENYNTQDVIDKYQVAPLQIIELKALMGDSADNIPGVPGIGEKTATNLIVQYGNIENAYAHVEEIKPNRAKNALQEHYDMAVMSKALATINTDCDYDYDWDKAKLGNIYTEEAYALIKRLEFRNMLSRFRVDAPANEKIEKIFQMVEDFGEADQVLTKAAAASRLAFAVHQEEGQVLALSLTLSEKETYVIPVEGFVTADWLLGRLGEAFAQVPEITTLKLKEALKCLSAHGVTIEKERQGAFLDAEIAAYLLNPLKDSYTCEELAKEYVSLTIPSRVELFGKDKLTKALEEKAEAFRIYGGYASYILYQSMPTLLAELHETGMEDLYREMELPLVFTLFGMEQEGIRVDAQALKTYGADLAVRIGRVGDKDL